MEQIPLIDAEPGRYQIAEAREKNVFGLRRVKLVLVLNERMDTVRLLDAIRHAAQEYKYTQDMVTISVTASGGDYVKSRWVANAAWISERIDKIKRGFYQNSDGCGLYWQINTEDSDIDNDSYAMHVMQSGKPQLFFMQYFKMIGMGIKTMRYAIKKISVKKNQG